MVQEGWSVVCVLLPAGTVHAPTAKEKGTLRLTSRSCDRATHPKSLRMTLVLELPTSSSRESSPAFMESSGISGSVIVPLSSEGALQQAVAATPSGTHLLGPEPFHHVACVATVPTGQAEVGRTTHSHVADGTLEREAFADGTLGTTDLAPAVTAVHSELDPFVRVRRAGHKLQHFRSLLSQTPAVEDLPVALLKVIKLLGIGRVQEPFVFIMLVSFPLTGVTVGQTPKAEFLW